MGETDTDLFLDSQTGLPEDMLLPADDINATVRVELPDYVPEEINIYGIEEKIKEIVIDPNGTGMDIVDQVLTIIHDPENKSTLTKFFNRTDILPENWLRNNLQYLSSSDGKTLRQDGVIWVARRVVGNINWDNFPFETNEGVTKEILNKIIQAQIATTTKKIEP